jgi:DNA-binding MarR family transcriptional regulator
MISRKGSALLLEEPARSEAIGTGNLAIRGRSRLEVVEEAFQRLHHVTSQIEMSLRPALAENGITLAGLFLLQNLITRQGPATATELADTLMVTRGAITVFMDRLEAEGFITRTQMPMDRRVVLVEPTEKARTWFERLRIVEVDELAHTFQGWNEHDIKKLLSLLNRLKAGNGETRSKPRKKNGF